MVVLFKNLNNKKAWEIIKQTGCDNFKEGDALYQKNTVIFLLITEKPNLLILKN